MLEESSDWAQLQSILTGLHKGRSTPSIGAQEKIIRRAIRTGHYGIVLQCLGKPDETGLTLKNDVILNLTLWGLHSTAETNGWEEGHVHKALRYSDTVAQLLEQDGHTRGKTTHNLVPNDPRTNPRVIGVFLEIAAVKAYKFQKASDEDGSVKKYAERMMACFENYEEVRQ